MDHDQDDRRGTTTTIIAATSGVGIQGYFLKHVWCISMAVMTQILRAKITDDLQTFVFLL